MKSIELGDCTEFDTFGPSLFPEGAGPSRRNRYAILNKAGQKSGSMMRRLYKPYTHWQDAHAPPGLLQPPRVLLDCRK